jgi:ubiquinone/menaquinone biosynthesis C-methylase UbiE
MTLGFQFDRSDIAERYDLGRQLGSTTVAALGDFLRRNAPGNVRRVLDLGCGTGRFSRMLIDAFGAPVIAVEPAGNMLAAAVAKQLGSSIHFVRGSATAIPVESRAFDVVFISQVLHHLPDLHNAIVEMRRVLAVGGRLFVRQTTLENLDSYFYQRFFPEARSIDDRRLPPREKIIAAARTAGFSLAASVEIFQPEVAASSREYVAKVATRAYSDLAMISDESFARGMEELTQYAAAKPDRAWVEEVDHFVFESA